MSETEKTKPEGKGRAAAVAEFLSTFLITLILIIAAVLVILNVLGWKLLCIESPSMSPKYPVGTLVVVRPADAQTITEGDVITYVANAEGTLVTHRVVSVDAAGQTFTTQGDANNVADSPVLWGNLVGKVVIGIPVVGKAFEVISAEENRKIVIGVIIALFAVTIVFDVTGRRKKKAQQSPGDDTQVISGEQDTGREKDGSP
ncbi:MAG: signal peptidase I [Clostridiales bacterium]|nr:signal peptidase I [Clostridiales bacterium]